MQETIKKHRYVDYLRKDKDFCRHVTERITADDTDYDWHEARCRYSFANINMSQEDQEVLGVLMKKATPHPRDAPERNKRLTLANEIRLWAEFPRREFADG